MRFNIPHSKKNPLNSIFRGFYYRHYYLLDNIVLGDTRHRLKKLDIVLKNIWKCQIYYLSL